MRRYLTVLALITCLLVGLGGGAYITDRTWDHYASPTITQCTIITFQTCLYMVDSEMVRFIARANAARLRELTQRMERCGEFLDSAGASVADEETSLVLGEIRLFYDGYTAVIKDVIATQVQLELLFNGFVPPDFEGDIADEILRLTSKQADNLTETEKFLDRMQGLLAETWK